MSQFSRERVLRDYQAALWEAGTAEAKGADGQFAKHIWVMEFNALSASRVDIQDQGGVRTRPTAAGLVRIVSSSANDTAGGSGARAVLVRGLGAGSVSGAAGLWKTEVVPTNGLGNAFTTETFLDVQDIIVADAGVTDVNDGVIDAYVGDDHQLRIEVDPSGVGNGTSKSGHLFTPVGWYGTINTAHVGWTGSNEVSTWFGVRLLGSQTLIWPLSKKLVTSQEIAVNGITTLPGSHVCVQGQRAGGGSAVPIDINTTVVFSRL